MQTVTLNNMAIGQAGTIAALTGSDAVCHRLLEMGITPGAAVEVARYAPMGDPMDIKIRGYHLSLRRREAETIQVHLCPQTFQKSETPK